LERAPGREAYPGDIFYLHSQLLERAGKLNFALGGGSMTFLPIAETLQGDITGYIQTNLISITDGQVYTSSALFREGFKPAIDLGLSISRIGSKVQYAAIKEVSSGLRMEYARYRQMLRLTKLRTRLSNEALELMRRGDTLRELLVQTSNAPVSTEAQAVIFYAFKRKILENLPLPALRRFSEHFFAYLELSEQSFVQKMRETKDLSIDIKVELDKIIVKFFRGMREVEIKEQPPEAQE
jgi:F-type H+-transporting ATPase subunit alpha